MSLTNSERQRRAQQRQNYRSNYEEIFGARPEVQTGYRRTRKVWDKDYEMLVDADVKAMSESNMFNELRSDLPSPYIAPAFAEHRNMRTGEMVSDRRRHREILKEHGLEEVGNTPPEMMERPKWLVEKNHEDSVRRSVIEVVNAAEDGQLQNMREKLGIPPTREVPELGDVAVDVSALDDGEFVRS